MNVSINIALCTTIAPSFLIVQFLITYSMQKQRGHFIPWVMSTALVRPGQFIHHSCLALPPNIGRGIETGSMPIPVATVQVLEFSNGKLVLLKTGQGRPVHEAIVLKTFPWSHNYCINIRCTCRVYNENLRQIRHGKKFCVRVSAQSNHHGITSVLQVVILSCRKAKCNTTEREGKEKRNDQKIQVVTVEPFYLDT